LLAIHANQRAKIGIRVMYTVLAEIHARVWSTIQAEIFAQINECAPILLNDAYCSSCLMVAATLEHAAHFDAHGLCHRSRCSS
jgi:hypothetical protein